MSDLVSNKKAYFDYEILDTFEAGVVLFGYEVKALRANKASLNGAYVIIRGGEAYLVNATISPYQVPNTPKKYEPDRARKLLLSKKQLALLEQSSEKQGLTIVALKWYNDKRHLKLAIAIAKGKKQADKRESLKKRDSKRDIDRILKSQ
jgi:SsrA-binding protein